MPLLPKVFRREKSATHLSTPEKGLGRSHSSSTNQSSEYVLADSGTPSDANGSQSGGRTPSPNKQSTGIYSNAKASGSKLKLSVPGFRKKAASPEKAPTSPKSPRSSMSVRSDTSFHAPTRSSIFNAFDRSASSQSLPTDVARRQNSVAPQLPPIHIDRSPKRPPALTTQTLPVPKTPEMRTSNTVKIFNWGSKPSKITSAPQVDLKLPSSSTQSTLDSFNLKSFRPVRPASPSNALELNIPPTLLEQPINQSPLTLAPPSPIGSAPRARHDSVGSESSQRITVAQFRQAQLESAKNRSSVHLPVPEHPSDGMPPGNVPLHVSLARPISPSFAAGISGYNSGNESGDGGTPSRPARLLPPQGLGRSSPVPGRSSPAPGRVSPIPRDHAPAQSSPLHRPVASSLAAPVAKSARWMASSDSDSESSDDDDVTSVDHHARPARRPPLIPDFQGMRTPSPANGSPVGRPYPSSFARTASPNAGPRVGSTSKSDLGHYTNSETRVPSSTGASPKPSPVVGSLPVPTQSSLRNIRPGQYSNHASPVQTHARSNSGDGWSNTHSATHSRQNSNDHVPKAKSELGHGSSSPSAKDSTPSRRPGAADRRKLSSSRSKREGPSRSLSIDSSMTLGSSFAAAKTTPKSQPAESETDEVEESERASSDDDAPLSAYMHGRRQGSGSASPAAPANQIPSGSPNIKAVQPEQRLQTVSPAPTETSNKATSIQGSAKSTPSPLPVNDSLGKPTAIPGRSPHTQPSLEFFKPPSQSLARSSPLVSNNRTPDSLPDSRSQSSLETPNNTGTIRPLQANNRSSSIPIPTQNVTPATSAVVTPSSFSRAGRTVLNRNPELLPKSILREESPASSIGNSSIASAVLPLTPRSDSDTGLSGNTNNSVITTSSISSAKDNTVTSKKADNPRRASVTFGDTVVINHGPSGRSVHRINGSTTGSEASNTNRSNRTSVISEEDAKRNERRRNEAKEAIELGRVVNGPAPVVSDDEDEDAPKAGTRQVNMPDWNTWQAFTQAQQMQAMAAGFGPGTPNGAFGMGMPGMSNMSNFNPFMQMNMNMPMGSSPPSFPSMMPNPMSPMGMGMGPMGMPNFGLPPVPQMPAMPNMMMGADPAMMAAHQQAMMMAKQAYQMAVAQQAIAAAGDEWERSSNMGGFSGMPSRPPSLFGMNMGMGMGMGSPMGSPSPSMYGGSMLGVNMNMNGGNWGGSVYGENFGPSSNQQRRQPSNGAAAMNSSASDFVAQPRKRTITAPSSSHPPAHLRGAGAPPLPPPSSWRPSS